MFPNNSSTRARRVHVTTRFCAPSKNPEDVIDGDYCEICEVSAIRKARHSTLWQQRGHNHAIVDDNGEVRGQTAEMFIRPRRVGFLKREWEALYRVAPAEAFSSTLVFSKWLSVSQVPINYPVL